jgi:hypothetical protein
LTLASRYLVMKQGRIVASGETGLSGTKERIENQLRL